MKTFQQAFKAGEISGKRIASNPEYYRDISFKERFLHVLSEKRGLK